MRLLADHLAPRLIGREAERDRSDLAGARSRPTPPRSARSALALAAVDTALWDLRCHGRPAALDPPAGRGPPSALPTEEVWLHIDATLSSTMRSRRASQGLLGSKIKVGRPHVAEELPRPLAAVRSALGPVFEIMVDANSAALADAIRRARASPTSISPGSRSRCPPTISRPCRLAARDDGPGRGRRIDVSIRHFPEYMAGRGCSSCRSMSPASAGSRPG